MINDKKVFAIIMAAGKGTRIGAIDKPKVMFEVAGKPIIGWGIEPLDELKKEGFIDRIITVVGFFGDQVVDYLGERSEFVWQKEQLGTGHAVLQAEQLIGNEEGYTIITNGDHALYTKNTYLKVLKQTECDKLAIGFAVVRSGRRFDDYGRVVRGEKGRIIGIVEKPEASEEQRKIAERNPNLFVVDNKWLFSALKRIKQSAVKKEYYIVDIVRFAIEEGKKVETVEIDDQDEALGINTEEDRQEVEKILRSRKS